LSYIVYWKIFDRSTTGVVLVIAGEYIFEYTCGKGDIGSEVRGTHPLSYGEFI
jgi:hypothetical protein